MIYIDMLEQYILSRFLYHDNIMNNIIIYCIVAEHGLYCRMYSIVLSFPCVPN